jgi:hypothetical protein
VDIQIGEDNKKIQVTYDHCITSDEISKIVEAFEDINNYGMYISNMQNHMNVKDIIEKHFGPTIPAKRKMIERQQEFLFPIKTKSSIDDLMKSIVSKPNILHYYIKDNMLVFDNVKNPSKKNTRSIIETVLKNAKLSNYVLDEIEHM